VSPFERALRERIAAEGAMAVEAYMEACNSYYYATRDPLGTRGDFTTAPEISQMFGEMVGGALADCWKRGGAPAEAIYVELGPGRGTLARDALRVMRSAAFAGEVHFVESSPLLREKQKQSVPEARWHDSVQGLPSTPMLLIANEFFDALPIQQHVSGIERRVRVAAGGLAFDRDGEIVETSPVRDGAVISIASSLVANGGAAMVIDYGHERSAPGDTLQAVRGHKHAAVLAAPGEQDLTSHVDFEAVAKAACGVGAAVTPVVSQSEWLIRLGIDARAQALARANPERSTDIEAAVERLTSPAQMGELFKVVAIHAPDWPAPAGLS
jgi:NADH dehydrogenase [ubiquinone] 1 alpha subcomplex assembly factor 7